MAKKYNMLNYGKKYKQAFIDMLQDTTTSIRIPDEVTVLGRDRWYGDTNLTYVDFNKVEIIPPDTCRDCTNLTQVIFSTHTTQIGSYAFSGCTHFEDTELPHTLTNIGQYAFQNVGSAYSRGTHTFTMIDDVGIHTTIGDNAFYGSHLSKINAYTNSIGSSAFDNCASLTDVNLEIHGSLGSNAFYRCNYVENFTISPNSVITSLGYSVFYGLAANKPTAVIAPFDFRNSTFTSLSSDIWYNNKYNGTIYFPSTLTSINGNFLNSATGNWMIYFNSAPTVSSSYYLRNNTSSFTVKYIFPYLILGDVAGMTNWSSHTSQMIGHSSGFEAGTTLPQYNPNNGHEYSWYEDDALTVPVTISQGANITYYCSVSASPVVSYIESIVGLDASVVLEGSDGNTYSMSNRYIPITVTVTVVSTPTDPLKPDVYKIYVNGQDMTSSAPVTIVGNGKPLTIGVSYWDGINPPELQWAVTTMEAEFAGAPTSSTGKSLVYGGKLYWSTGYAFGSIGTYSKRVAYDPSTDTVDSSVANFDRNGNPYGGWGGANYVAFVNNNHLEYLCGYRNGASPDYQSYDPSNNTITATPLTNGFPGHFCGNTINDGHYAYAVDGTHNSNTPGYLYRIDLTSTPPYTYESLGVVHGSMISDVINNKIYIFGALGTTSSPGYSHLPQTIECFDLATNTLSTCNATLPQPYSGGTFAICTVNNKVYILGGILQLNSGLVLTNAILEYDPLFDVIRTLNATLPTAAWGHQCGVINGAIYLMGGQTGTGFSTQSDSDPHIYKLSH